MSNCAKYLSVMPYQVHLSHINADYSVVPLPIGTWSSLLEDDDDLIILLNRVAITSSQHPSHEYPIITVVAGSIRATITVIGGQLYYTDPNALNRSNIKVVADGVMQLLKGSSFESVLQSDAATILEEAELADNKSRRSWFGPRVRGHLLVVLLIVLLAVLSNTVISTWKQLTAAPNLVPVFDFTPGAIAGESIRAYSGLYMEDYQEGGKVIELTGGGQFKLYEMWRSAVLEGFTLKQVESLPLRLGSKGDKPALVAGEFYLLLPKEEDRMLLNGILFRRHFGALDNIGNLQQNQ